MFEEIKKILQQFEDVKSLIANATSWFNGKKAAISIILTWLLCRGLEQFKIPVDPLIWDTVYASGLIAIYAEIENLINAFKNK